MLLIKYVINSYLYIKTFKIDGGRKQALIRIFLKFSSNREYFTQILWILGICLFALTSWGQECAHSFALTAHPQNVLSIYEKRASQGDPEALFQLGMMYKKGTQQIPQNIHTAVSYLEKAAQNHHASARYELSEIFDRSPYRFRQDQGFSLALLAAHQGHLKAQLKMGRWLYSGGEMFQSYKNAYHWLKKAADQGDPEACRYLGKMYRKGLFVKKDLEEANKWFKKAEILLKTAEQEANLPIKKISSKKSQS